MPPNPFCCPSAIPLTTQHLSSLLPINTTHTPLQEPLSPGPLITSFILFVLANPTAITPSPSKPPPSSPLPIEDFEDISLTTPSPPKPAWTEQPLSSLAQQPKSRKERMASISHSNTPAATTLDSDSDYILIPSTTPTEPGLQPGFSPVFFAILSLTCISLSSSTKTLNEGRPTRYFAACEEGKGKETVLGSKSRVFGRVWTELGGERARGELNRVRAVGVADSVKVWKKLGREGKGNGKGKEMDGDVERWWCGVCGVGWEMRVWIRE